MNPSFPLTASQSQNALREMAKEPKPLERPVVILAGLWDPGLATDHVASVLKKLVHPESTLIEVSFVGAHDFDACRDRVLSEVNKAVASHDPLWTVEVDVVAISMGGLVARHAAAPRNDGEQRLRVTRLFTISTPHRGAALAWAHFGDRRIVAMNHGSEFLAELDAAIEDAGYELFPYVRLGDSVVGVKNAAPPGRQAWWVQNPPLDMAHARCAHDSRILADIARRLRGELPYTTEPAAELPRQGAGR